MMHGAEKSGLVIVAGKPANKAEQPAPEGSAAMLNAAEPVERRAGTKGNADQQSTRRTQSRVSVAQALERIRQAARERRKERFTALFPTSVSSCSLRRSASLRRTPHRAWINCRGRTT